SQASSVRPRLFPAFQETWSVGSCLVCFRFDVCNTSSRGQLDRGIRGRWRVLCRHPGNLQGKCGGRAGCRDIRRIEPGEPGSICDKGMRETAAALISTEPCKMWRNISCSSCIRRSEASVRNEGA